MRKKVLSLFCILAIFALAGSGIAQKSKDCPDSKSKAKKQKTIKKPALPGFSFVKANIDGVGSTTENLGRPRFAGGFGDVEKGIRVNKNAVVSFCVIGASVRVNGWNRSEVRVFVRGSNKLAFKVRGVDRKDKKPVWVELNAGNVFGSRSGTGNCLRGRTIEIDAPKGASINVTGRSGATSVTIDSVEKTKVSLGSGDISLSNINRSVYAKTNVGAISVRNSSGDINLNTTAGNILAYRTDSNRIGDVFKARTLSGAITLRSVSQKEVVATSISGSLAFHGALLKYGNYEFTTTSGIIALALPSKSSFQLKAAYGGSFKSLFDLKGVEKTSTASAVYLTAKVGSGSDSTVSTLSYSGSISLTKIAPKPKKTVKP